MSLKAVLKSWFYKWLKLIDFFEEGGPHRNLSYNNLSEFALGWGPEEMSTKFGWKVALRFENFHIRAQGFMESPRL